MGACAAWKFNLFGSMIGLAIEAAHLLWWLAAGRTRKRPARRAVVTARQFHALSPKNATSSFRRMEIRNPAFASHGDSERLCLCQRAAAFALRSSKHEEPISACLRNECHGEAISLADQPPISRPLVEVEDRRRLGRGSRHGRAHGRTVRFRGADFVRFFNSGCAHGRQRRQINDRRRVPGFRRVSACCRTIRAAFFQKRPAPFAEKRAGHGRENNAPKIEPNSAPQNALRHRKAMVSAGMIDHSPTNLSAVLSAHAQATMQNEPATLTTTNLKTEK